MKGIFEPLGLGASFVVGTAQCLFGLTRLPLLPLTDAKMSQKRPDVVHIPFVKLTRFDKFDPSQHPAPIKLLKTLFDTMLLPCQTKAKPSVLPDRLKNLVRIDKP